MLNKIISVCFMLGCIVMGALWGNYFNEANQLIWIIGGVVIGGIVSGAILFFLRYVTQEMFERFSPALVFIALAMTVGYMLSRYITVFWTGADAIAQVFLTTSLVLVFGFVGISLGVTRATNWNALLRAVQRREVMEANPKILDTSVIIDGRLADICQTGFIEGTLLIPRFVLQELQRIADASDELRRARGRRGLDILKQLQEPTSLVSVQVIETDAAPEVREVDEKLVRLAREINAKIITNDLNLNKVAQIEGVSTLNINDLANALKPAVLPDERMQVRIVKEGKEAFQGVGYLDDGTMIVVDGGRDYIGRDVSVLVTSVLQTTAGRMIFTRLQNAS